MGLGIQNSGPHACTEARFPLSHLPSLISCFCLVGWLVLFFTFEYQLIGLSAFCFYMETTWKGCLWWLSPFEPFCGGSHVVFSCYCFLSLPIYPMFISVHPHPEAAVGNRCGDGDSPDAGGELKDPQVRVPVYQARATDKSSSCHHKK